MKDPFAVHVGDGDPAPIPMRPSGTVGLNEKEVESLIAERNTLALEYNKLKEKVEALEGAIRRRKDEEYVCADCGQNPGSDEPSDLDPCVCPMENPVQLVERKDYDYTCKDGNDP